VKIVNKQLLWSASEVGL